MRKLFSRPASPEELQQGLEQFATRRPQVIGNKGATWGANTRNRPRPDYDKTQKQILRDVSWLLPNSHLEMDNLVKALGPFEGNFTVVPYAVDPTVFLDPDPEPFVQKHGLRDFVLQVGRIEASKNQLLLCYALRDTGLPLVLIGGCMQPEYREWCRRYGGPDLTILDHLPPEQLRSAYAAARVHALPSWIETCGLATMEAALAGCGIVASSAGYELEYWGDLAYYCDPADYRSIRQAVSRAFHSSCPFCEDGLPGAGRIGY